MPNVPQLNAVTFWPAAAADIWSVTHDIHAVPMLRMSPTVAFCLAFCSASSRFGIRIAAMMPIMATTIRSSIRVKPFWPLRFASRINIPTSSYTSVYGVFEVEHYIESYDKTGGVR